jgi:hypothetical protein
VITLREGGPGGREECGDLIELEGLSLSQNAAGQPKLIGSGAGAVWGWNNPRTHPGAIIKADFGRSFADPATWLAQLAGGADGSLSDASGAYAFDATFVKPFASHKPLRVTGDQPGNQVFYQHFIGVPLKRAWLRSAIYIPTGMGEFYIRPGATLRNSYFGGDHFPGETVFYNATFEAALPGWWMWNYQDEPAVLGSQALSEIEGRWIFLSQLAELETETNPARGRVWVDADKKVDELGPEGTDTIVYEVLDMYFAYEDDGGSSGKRIAYGLVEMLDADRYPNPYGHAL